MSGKASTKTYLPRLLDAQLIAALDAVPAVHIAGAKATGKTETAKQLAASTLRLDEAHTRTRLEAEPAYFTTLPEPLLLDEWQRMPELWDAVKREVDRDSSPGRFVLTGSAHPLSAQIHSGAGRIVSLRMRPFSLQERRLTEATVSLTALFAGAAQVAGGSSLQLTDYVHEILASGFPGIRTLSARGRRLQLAAYVDNIIFKEFPEQGHVVRAPHTLRSWLRAYAAAAATTVSYAKILNAATPGDADKPAKTTTLAYRNILESLWLLDSVPAWLPSDDRLGRLGQAPKHFVADPALAATLLDIEADDLLDGGAEADPVVRAVGAQGTLLGRLFEQLVGMSLHSYAQSAEARLFHLRTRGGDHEVDFLVERKRRVVAFETKLSPIVRDEDVKHLLWLKERIGARLVDAAVITTGPEAYRRKDGIAVIPAALLGA